MKEFRLRIILILAAVALCIYLLYPTYADYQNSKKISEILDKKRSEIAAANPGLSSDQIDERLEAIEDSIKALDPSIAKARQDRIKLGLDLQGGMRVVLEVNTAKLLEKIAQNPDDTFKSVLADAEKESALSDESVVDILGRLFDERGVRLSRYFGTVREEDSEILDKLKTDAEDAVSRAMEIIRNRVDQYGVSEPSIQRQGTRRIIVELPGVAREEEAKQLLQGTALLEFRLVKDPEFTIGVMQRIDNILAGKVIEGTDASGDTLSANDTTQTAVDAAETAPVDTNRQLTEEEFKREHPFFSIAILDPQGRTAEAYVAEDMRDQLQRMLNRADVQRVIPDNVEFIFSAKPAGFQEGKAIYLLYLVNKEPELTGGVITNAQANIDPNTSSPVVSMEMNSEGATEWSRITGANIGKRIAIILDGVVFSAPNVQGKIPGGRSQITGVGNLEEAKLLEIILKAGALPAPVDIIEERTVGPSLGQDSINDGLFSFIMGYILTAIFMVIVYQRTGSIAAFSLIFTVLFILGTLAGFKGTLTLPGIAGIILTIAMAVDSNVLIYERIREELAVGKTIKAAVDSGFSRALSAIMDSNITTFFSGIILYQFGTGPIQGFALTLMIGIIASLISALVICRLILDYMVAKGIKITVG
ncbi:MAG: protein translocase subunit SecD [Ignavibacteriaceae bacterium]